MKRTLMSGLVLVTMTAASAVAAPLDGKGNDVLTGGFYQPSTTITGEPLSPMKRGRMICYPLPPEDCQ